MLIILKFIRWRKLYINKLKVEINGLNLTFFCLSGIFFIFSGKKISMIEVICGESTREPIKNVFYQFAKKCGCVCRWTVSLKKNNRKRLKNAKRKSWQRIFETSWEILIEKINENRTFGRPRTRTAPRGTGRHAARGKVKKRANW